MNNPIQGNHKFLRRSLFFVILLILIFISLACGIADLECRYYHSDCTSGNSEVTEVPNLIQMQTYASTGSADTTYVIAYGPPQYLTNVCHDDISDAIVKIYFTQTLPDNLGFTRKLTEHEYYFTAEIHSALSNPWRNKQCVYAENKNEYELIQINGIYDRTNVELIPLYVSYSDCANAPKFVTGGSHIELTYDCKRGPTTVHYYFDMPLQSTN
jgi:hypothetical protein